jgi:hypothetical protein
VAKGSLQIPVVRDLGLQRLCGLLHGGDGCKHLSKVMLQQLAPFGGGGVPFAAQPREGLHLPDGHLGLAQAQQESDPFHVRSRIAALATRRTRHGRNQPGALVVAQRVRGQARAFGDFGNGEEGCHGNDSESWSAL